MEDATYLVHKGIWATPQSRFFNYVIDRIVVVFVVGAIFIWIAFLMSILGIDNTSFYDWLSNLSRIEDFLFTNIVGVLYYFAFEALTGKTLGKYLTKTCVVDRYGNKVSSLALLKRSFTRAVPLEQFSFLGTYARGWHDTWSDTYVVYSKKLETEKANFIAINTIGKQDDQL